MNRKVKVLAVILGCIFVLGIVGSLCWAKTVKLETPCGAKIRCIYYASQADGKSPAVLILPGLSGLRTSLKKDYDSFARWLNKKHNFNVLVIDYRAMSNKEIMKMVKEHKTIRFVNEEVFAALSYLREQEKVDGEKISLIGCSFGTILTILTAAQDEEGIIKTIVFLSLVANPRPEWRWPGNPDFVQALPRYSLNRPILFLADKKDHMPQNDSNAAKNALYWSKETASETKVEISNRGLHAVELLRAKKNKEMVGTWLQEYLD